MTIIHNSLHAVWDRLEGPLQDALYGAFAKHGIISTRKAFAAVAGINPDVQRTFNAMSETVIPLEGQHSTPQSQWREQKDFFEKVSCSPCVLAACERLSKHSEGIITSFEFFSYLVQTSVGPTVNRWKEDGYSSERILTLQNARE